MAVLLEIAGFGLAGDAGFGTTPAPGDGVSAGLFFWRSNIAFSTSLLSGPIILAALGDIN
jgi:hypothetical protein